MNRLLSLVPSLLLPSRFSISASSETSTAELKARKDLALSGSESFSTPSARAHSYMPEATAIQARWNAVEALAPDGFTNIEDVMSYQQRMAIVRGYASTAGFAQSQVNKPKG